MNPHSLLPANLVEQEGDRLSVLCMRTAEVKYLVFGTEAEAPRYVVQAGSLVELTSVFETTSRLYQLLPHRIPEPLDLSPRDADRAVLVQRGLAGRPWFTLRERIRTRQDWLRIKDLSIEALRELHAASASQADWTRTFEPTLAFDEAHTRCLQAVDGLTLGDRGALEERRSTLATIGRLKCFSQHGDFCVNNLLFGSEGAGIIDFEHFGSTMSPFHDEFLLAGSLLALHPAREPQIDAALWDEIIDDSPYRELSEDIVEALFLTSLMWWIAETHGKLQREPMAKRYRRALEDTLRTPSLSGNWEPGRTVL